MNLCSIAEVRSILHQYGIRPKRKYGQNFLVDRNILEIILSAADIESDGAALEIGAGLGCLTAELALRARRVVTVDIDPVMTEILLTTLAGLGNVEIVNSDILRTDPDALGIAAGEDWTLVGNLPYYITSPILEWIVTYSDRFKKSVLMVQREVADRLIASAGTPEYSSFTLYLSYYFHITKAAAVSKNVFYPAPEVNSSIIVLQRRDTPAVAVKDSELLFNVVRSAFAMRRKTLENALGYSAALKWGKELAGKILDAAEIDRSLRGEKLSLQKFAELTNAAYCILRENSDAAQC